MFNVGGGEMLVLLLLGLLVLGPERLPKAMGQVGRYVAQLRRLSSGFQDEIRRAMEPDDAPFRPGEERLNAGAIDDEVRVVGADPLPDEADDGVIDTSATESDVPHRPAPTPPVDGTGPVRTDGTPPAAPSAVTPLRPTDEGDARAAG